MHMISCCREMFPANIFKPEPIWKVEKEQPMGEKKSSDMAAAIVITGMLKVPFPPN